MARGWESKSVEEQQSLKSAPRRADGGEATRLGGAAESAQLARRRQELELQRERILSERTASPVRRAALQAALEEIESRLKALGD